MRISNSKFTPTEKALDNVILASKRRLAVNKLAFFRTAIDYLKTVFTEDVGTMATNGVQLLIAPSFVERIMEMQNAFALVDGVLVHETKHNTDLHHIRMKGFDPKIFNIGADMSINFYVKRIPKLALPEGCVEGASGEFLDRENGYEPFAVEKIIRMIEQKSDQCGMSPEELYGDSELTGRVEEFVIQVPSSAPESDKLDKADTDDSDVLGSDDDADSDGDQDSDGSDGGSDSDGDSASDSDSGIRINPAPSGSDGEGDESSDNKLSGDGESESGGDASEDGGETIGGDLACDSDKTGWDSDYRGESNSTTRQPTPAEIAEETQKWINAQSIANKAQKSQGSGNGASAGFHYGRRKGDLPPGDFRVLLEKFVADIMENERTFRRISRRHIAHDLVMPTDCDDNIGPVLIMQDVSGSVGHRETLRFFDCIKDILAKWDITATLIQFDHQVQLVEDIMSSDLSHYEFKRAGSGGTDFDAPFDYVSEHILQDMTTPPSCAVVLTDMEASFPSQEPDYPVMWCSSNSWWNHTPPFGEVVHVM